MPDRDESLMGRLVAALSKQAANPPLCSLSDIFLKLMQSIAKNQLDTSAVEMKVIVF